MDARVLEAVRTRQLEKLEASVTHLVEVLSTKPRREVDAALAVIPTDHGIRRNVRRRVQAIRLARRLTRVP